MFLWWALLIWKKKNKWRKEPTASSISLLFHSKCHVFLTMPAENILCYSTACCHMNVHNKPTTQWISVLVCSCDFTICVSVSVRLQNKQSNCVRVQFKASTELCRNIDWVSISKSNKKKKITLYWCHSFTLSQTLLWWQRELIHYHCVALLF